ncbi:MAG: hypothetical protein R3F31_07710 [Verrucomicrobiales bacterium]
MNSLPTIDGLDLRLVLSHVDDLAGAVAGRPELGGLAKFDQAAAAAGSLAIPGDGEQVESASRRSGNCGPRERGWRRRWKSCSARPRCP